jgi:hypothetical protein
VSDRFGFRPLDFDPVIVLLTAIHFHYAGFALPLVTGLAARRLDSGTARLAAAGVIAGVPLVAIGITSTQLKAGPLIESLAAWVLAAAGILTASLHLRLAFGPGRPLVRFLWAVAAVSLVGSMVLAAIVRIAVLHCAILAGHPVDAGLPRDGERPRIRAGRSAGVGDGEGV